MTAAPPPWFAPDARLIEAGGPYGWAEIAAEAARLEVEFRAAGHAAVDATRPTTVVAALVAAERVGVELHLKRHKALLSPTIRNGREKGWDEGAAMGRTGDFTLLLETSGTTGTPKRARHDFERLRGRLRGTAAPSARWLLTYESGAFAGLQVILTALASGSTLIAVPGAGAADLARAAVRHGATHISGTPSFWRAFLLTLGAERPPLASITLGGEAADQPLLDRLRECFPDAKLRHIYASTEAGALFAVTDGRAGFPAAWLETGVDGVALRVRDGVLEVNSPRAMLGYAGASSPSDDWLSTGDVVELRGDRVLFAGRLDGRVNVGGIKVSPEAVEHLLLAIPGVQDALVRPAASPITGHILTASVVPQPGVEEAALRAAIRDAAATLPPAARPRVVSIVENIPLESAGKKKREGAA